MNSFNTMLSKTVCRIGGGVYDLTQHAFPAVVRIETTNACNACCTICPRRTIHRRITRMDDALYLRLIDESPGLAAGKSNCIISASRLWTNNSKCA